MLDKPGPLMTFRPMVPQICPTGWAKLEVLNHGIADVNSVQNLNRGNLIWRLSAARQVQGPALAVNVKGVPVRAEKIPDSCHPPMTAAAGPEVSQCWPLPNGNW